MIIAPPKRPRSTEDSLLPLINIVFLLLIFFMLAGVLTQKPPFELRTPSTADINGAAQLQHKVLDVGVDGHLAFAGQPIKRDELGKALADWPQDKSLQIRAAADIKAGQLSSLFAALRRAGISQVDLLTRHKQS
ncbi:ExbD/TolR family protein [Salinisphaera orenii]|uniref:ExbD/TolR family protein n=1 Tax=Salinisphaera orenii TaxID=856731 RepID=UPI000DBE3D4C